MHVRVIAALAAAAAMLVAAAPAGAASAAGDGLPGVAELDVPRASERALADAFERAVVAGERVRELRGARPSWYTPAVERRMKRDRDGVQTAPVDAPLPGEVGIRPGSWMVSPYLCTMNFIFRKGTTLAIGTAGHCVEGNEPVVLLTLAPTGGNPVLVELGRVLLKRDAGIGKDYALVEIPPERHQWVFPTLAVVGGPCGVYYDTTPQPVAHYGHGVVVGTGGTPRAGMGFALERDPGLVRGVDWDWDQDSIVWAGLINGGDSGSGVRVGHLPAVSNLTHGIGITGLEPSALAWGTRVSTVTGGGWELVSSPLCPPA